MTDQITVSVDSEIATLYRSASEQDRRKYDLLVNIGLRNAIRSDRSLGDIIREASRTAQQNGLTPEILQSILDEE